ncbi:hypothetical protein [Gluconobacter frateurii]|uniref:Cytoplasmic protein n=1 Tax=Gluconobacter frateurii NRIC 0228 TaxID=1307946 RepID=A0ABQ0QFP2_9PROT|nr:hypothetical protein [Gluconobacter frateurii]GBR17497.1 hypothetical protein AA0228_3042 [Gluconobacter frateurii NRIC 0228]GLP89620.1 hypothetical protein GCM10007868_06950 [Gluconobacter frateurii]
MTEEELHYVIDNEYLEVETKYMNNDFMMFKPEIEKLYDEAIQLTPSIIDDNYVYEIESTKPKLTMTVTINHQENSYTIQLVRVFPKFYCGTTETYIVTYYKDLNDCLVSWSTHDGECSVDEREVSYDLMKRMQQIVGDKI